MKYPEFFTALVDNGKRCYGVALQATGEAIDGETEEICASTFMRMVNSLYDDGGCETISAMEIPYWKRRYLAIVLKRHLSTVDELILATNIKLALQQMGMDNEAEGG